MKTIQINGEINPEMLENLARQIEQEQIAQGDSVDVLFDTEGGHVDVAFAIADAFCSMQDEGIELRAVADNKVWSSGIVPFLACNTRIARAGSSFLVHQVKINTQTEATFGKADLDGMLQEIDNYAELLNEYYASYEITPEVRSHLMEGDDLKISDPQQMVDAGFVQSMSEDLPKSPGNYLNRFWEWCFPPAPSFAFINKSSTIITQTMTKNQVENIVRKELAGMLPNAIAQAVRLVNQQAEDPEAEEVTNEEEVPETEQAQKSTGLKMLAQELKKLTGMLQELVDAEIAENQDVETDAPELVPENEEAEEEKPLEVNKKACNSAKATKAPVNRSAPIAIPTKAVESLYNQAAAYGPGCVGARKR